MKSGQALTWVLLHGVLLVLLVAGGSGCASIRQGWHQERELDGPFRALILGEKNTVTIGNAFRVGLSADLHYWQPLEDAARGLRADLDYLNSRRP